MGRTAQFRNIAALMGTIGLPAILSIFLLRTIAAVLPYYVDGKYILWRGCKASKSKARKWAASRKRARAYGTYPTKKGGFG